MIQTGRRLALLAVILWTVGCAFTGPRPAILQVRCNVPAATLWIDDTFAGRVADWSKGLPLGPGFRRVEIRQPGYFPFFAELTPEEGQSVTIRAELRPEPD